MKLALALMIQNSEAWLRLHLTRELVRQFDGLVVVDGGSTDAGADYVRSLGGTVVERSFEWDFGAQGNYLIEQVEQLGFTAMMRLDPDEMIFAGSVPGIRARLSVPCILTFPRYNFVRDRMHVNPLWYPDHQARAWRLGCGVRYEMVIHETPTPVLPTMATLFHIYHYGWIADPDELIEKQRNYHRLSNLPFHPPAEFSYPPAAPFDRGEQPLNPFEIGVRAPYV